MKICRFVNRKTGKIGILVLSNKMYSLKTKRIIRLTRREMNKFVGKWFRDGKGKYIIH